ncbi:serine/threonine-protein kinase NLK isoform X2 [Acanthochromis polyacanthus]|uniref:serine/threonine-protein kinase NLK isoform X2 n=1 Tax=Acanthochromis polyacanthus TaxID=80966 RepID=UPI00223491E5|nr:serine/threonine-protein kinase NLK isoform X2 [Acanthochromis polyacanthus]
MLFGLETVSLRKRQEAELEVAELKMLRFSLGVTRMDKIRIEYIRGTAHVRGFGDKVRESRLRWFGHVQRRESEYIGRRMLSFPLPGRRPRGRPKRRFMDVVRVDMKVVGVGEEDAEDRVRWRQLIHRRPLKGKAKRKRRRRRSWSACISCCSAGPAWDGLKYLHSAGILHRDIKPGNLLVNSNCVLKICDFGLARVEESDESRHMTQEVVTQYYRAPEILMGSRHYSNSIDIWSVGCIFAELLGRRILFQAQSPIQQLDLITDLLGTPSMEAMRTACEGARAHILRGPHKQPSLPVLYTLSSQATHEAVHLLCRMLVFDPSKRISAKDALAHPYLDEGRLRYHTCMCKCCFTTSSGRVYTSDFEPITNPKFDDGFEKNLSSVRQVKEIIHQFILEQQKGSRVPLCINPQSAAFKSFISSTVAQPSEMPPSPLVWE